MEVRRVDCSKGANTRHRLMKSPHKHNFPQAQTIHFIKNRNICRHRHWAHVDNITIHSTDSPRTRASLLSRLLCQENPLPIVLTGLTDDWGVRKWTPVKIKQLFGHLEVPVEFRQLSRKHGMTCNKDAAQVHTTTISSFINWLQRTDHHYAYQQPKTSKPATEPMLKSVAAGVVPTASKPSLRSSSGSALPSPDHYSAYMSYQHFRTLFDTSTKDVDIARAALPWETLGVKNVSAMDSTLWVGSAGAFTALHYDSYGANLHMQVCESVHI